MAVASADSSVDAVTIRRSRRRSSGAPDADGGPQGGENAPEFGFARTRISVEKRQLAFLDGLAARVRGENDGRLSRAELFAILIRVLLSAELDPEKMRSENALIVLLHERVRMHEAERAEDLDARRSSAAISRADVTQPAYAVNLRIPSDELARLDALLATARRQAGAFVGRSGAIRALTIWLAEMRLGIDGIRTGADLERRLGNMVSPLSNERGRVPDAEIQVSGEMGGIAPS